MKPNLYQQDGWWVCELGDDLGIGATPFIAFHKWKKYYGSPVF